MILATDTLEVREVPLDQLHVTEHQKRFPDRVAHYLNVLGDNQSDWLGLIHVKPTSTGYEILDGHHRFAAYMLAGRPSALCLIVHTAKKVRQFRYRPSGPNAAMLSGIKFHLLGTCQGTPGFVHLVPDDGNGRIVCSPAEEWEELP